MSLGFTGRASRVTLVLNTRLLRWTLRFLLLERRGVGAADLLEVGFGGGVVGILVRDPAPVTLTPAWRNRGFARLMGRKPLIKPPIAMGESR